MTEQPAAAAAELISRAERDVPAAKIEAVVAEKAAKHAHRVRLLEDLRADPAVLVSGANSMPRTLQRVIEALIVEGATSLRLPSCAGCGVERLLPSHLDGQAVCATCYRRARTKAITCHRCGRERQLGSSFGDADYCGACWRAMYEEADSMFLDAARLRAPQIDPAALVQAFRGIEATPGRRLRFTLDFVENGADWFEQPAAGSALFTTLYAALRAHVPDLSPLVCGHCGNDRKLVNIHEGLRCCVRCYAAMRASECGGCGRTLPVAHRAADGTRLCQGCAKSLPSAQADCIRCDTLRPVAFRGPDGPMCGPCRSRENVGTCTRCGREAPCRFAGTPRAVCENCRKAKEACSRCAKERIVSTRDEDGAPVCHGCNRSIEQCSQCTRARRVVGRTGAGEPLCEGCYPHHPASFRDCRRCGQHAKVRRNGLCDRCTADDKLASLFPPDLLERSEPARNMLAALRGADYRTILNAFTRRRSVEILRKVLAASDPPTHESIDLLGPDQTTRAVRALLVEHGLLPSRDLHLARFEAWIEAAAEDIEGPGERQAFVQFARWQHLRNLRDRADPLHGSLASSRRAELRTVLKLLAWARERGKDLSTLDQADMDVWAMTGGSQPYLVAKFLDWARVNRQCRRLEAARSPRRYLMVGGIPDEDRSRRLAAVLGDDTIPPGTKLAAALVLLFGVSPLRISALRLVDVEHRDGAVTIRIGKTPLELPAALVGLAVEACADRSARRMFGAVEDREWLYPGSRPGVPLTSASLIRRLAAVGVFVAPARTGARTSLAQQLPPVVIADLTGVHIGTAVRWSNSTAASNARYAGLLLDRDDDTADVPLCDEPLHRVP